MMYYVFFPDRVAVCPHPIVSEADEQIKDFQQRIVSITAEGETLKKQLGEKEAEVNNSAVTIEQLERQIQKLTDEMKSSQTQLRVYEEELKDKDSQIQKTSDKLKIKEEEVQKADDKLKEEKELILKKEELMLQKIEDRQRQLNTAMENIKNQELRIKDYQQRISELSSLPQDTESTEELKKKISSIEAKLADTVRKNNEWERQSKVQAEEIRKENQEKVNELTRENEELSKRIEESNKQIAVLKEAEAKSKATNEELNVRQKELLEYLKENKKITRKEYIDKFNVSMPTAARDFKELQDKNIIKPYGPLGQGRYFVLTEDGERKTDGE